MLILTFSESVQVFVEHVQDDPATMFYHWWRYFKEVYSRAKSQSSLNKISHYIVDRPPNTQFFHYFGLLSRNCWRRSTSLPPKTCFCDGKSPNMLIFSLPIVEAAEIPI